jgi:transposase
VRDRLSLHEITKRTGMSCNTARRWLRAQQTRPQNRQSPVVWVVQIKASGYEGSYSRVTDYIRAWRANAGKDIKAFVPLRFELGEAFQFDWSEEGMVIGGIYRRMQVSHMKLCASRAF